jgi:hypothetical protein
MKTSIYSKGKVVMTLILVLFSLNSFSQDNRLSKKELKEAKKEREAFDFQVIDTLLQNKSFVLEADYLENQYGERFIVTPNLNFIMVDSTEVTLQTGNNIRIGSNGVGGVTAQGNVKDLNITKNVKNHSFWMRFTMVTNIGIYDVDMTIYSDRYAKATITGLTRGKLVYDGHLQALYDSKAYKGRNSI